MSGRDPENREPGNPDESERDTPENPDVPDDSQSEEEAWISGEIPPVLHSVEHEGPFAKCTACQAPLEGMYQIHKAFRGEECVLEMAVCFQCMQGLSSEYSAESLEAIRVFLSERGGGFFGGGEDGCGFCDGADARGYSIVGVCRAETLLFPIVRVCETCEEEMQKKLSKKTRDINDGFIRDNLPGVPEDIDVNSPLGAFF